MTSKREAINPRDGIEIYLVTLGEIGRKGNAHIEETNKHIGELVVQFQNILESDAIKPLDYVQVGEVGFEKVLKALDTFSSHKSGKKVIVQLADA